MFPDIPRQRFLWCGGLPSARCCGREGWWIIFGNGDGRDVTRAWRVIFFSSREGGRKSKWGAAPGFVGGGQDETLYGADMETMERGGIFVVFIFGQVKVQRGNV